MGMWEHGEFLTAVRDQLGRPADDCTMDDLPGVASAAGLNIEPEELNRGYYELPWGVHAGLLGIATWVVAAMRRSSSMVRKRARWCS
ncbi:hypothetical protein BH18ACT4_BH18ACT4_11410 [soil metagenome]